MIDDLHGHFENLLALVFRFDEHFKIEGEAVHELTELFLGDYSVNVKEIPEPENFSELKEGKLEVVPSTFDFTKSPVFVLNRFKMTLKERKQNLPNIVQIVTQLTKGKFKDEWVKRFN